MGQRPPFEIQLVPNFGAWLENAVCIRNEGERDAVSVLKINAMSGPDQCSISHREAADMWALLRSKCNDFFLNSISFHTISLRRWSLVSVLLPLELLYNRATPIRKWNWEDKNSQRPTKIVTTGTARRTAERNRVASAGGAEIAVADRAPSHCLFLRLCR